MNNDLKNSNEKLLMNSKTKVVNTEENWLDEISQGCHPEFSYDNGPKMIEVRWSKILERWFEVL